MSFIKFYLSIVPSELYIWNRGAFDSMPKLLGIKAKRFPCYAGHIFEDWNIFQWTDAMIKPWRERNICYYFYLFDWKWKGLVNIPGGITHHSGTVSTLKWKCAIQSVIKWASSWNYGPYHIGNQRRLRWVCASAQSHQSLRYSHTWSMKVGWRVWPKIRHLAPLNDCACVFEEWVYGGRKVP